MSCHCWSSSKRHPQPANKHYVRITLHHREVVNAPAHHRWANLAQLQVLEFVDALAVGGSSFQPAISIPPKTLRLLPTSKQRHSLMSLSLIARRGIILAVHYTHLCFLNDSPVRRKSRCRTAVRYPLHNLQSHARLSNYLSFRILRVNRHLMLGYFRAPILFRRVLFFVSFSQPTRQRPNNPSTAAKAVSPTFPPRPQRGKAICSS